MSVFSQKMQALIQPRIDKGQLTIYGLAQNSKIDRSSLYKFLNGERLPASLAVLNRLMEALRLSPTQSSELRTAYDISRMGEESYQRRRNTVEFLNDFNQYVDVHSLTPVPILEPLPLPKEGAEVRSGILAVNSLVQSVVVAEATRPNGKIRVIAQPEYDFLIHSLSSLTLGRPCSIEHVICLESDSPEGDNQYNLDCLRAVVELMLSNRDYKPYYYYDSITSHFKNSNLLPYLVVTSECALQISYNRNYAICLRGEKYVSFFENLFDDACKRSNLMISTLGTITENLQYYYHEFVNRQSSPRWSCSCNPYFILYIDRPLLENISVIPQTVRRSFRHFCTIKTIGVPLRRKRPPILDILPGKGWNISAAPVASGIHLIPSMRLWNRATVGRFFGAFVKTPILLAPVCCCENPRFLSPPVWRSPLSGMVLLHFLTSSPPTSTRSSSYTRNRCPPALTICFLT